jgi:hypothetical protein
MTGTPIMIEITETLNNFQDASPDLPLLFLSCSSRSDENK